MNSIGAWVRNIALVVVLAGIMELLLPQGEMRRYVRVVAGLLVLLAMLNPVVGLLEGATAFNAGYLAVFAPRTSGAGLEAIRDRGESLKRVNETLAVDEFRRRLEAEAAMVASGAAGGARAEATVDLEASTGGGWVVRRINLTVLPGKNGGEVMPVRPVILGPDRGVREEGNAPEPEGAGRIARAVAGYFGLATEAVSVLYGAD